MILTYININSELLIKLVAGVGTGKSLGHLPLQEKFSASLSKDWVGSTW